MTRQFIADGRWRVPQRGGVAEDAAGSSPVTPTRKKDIFGCLFSVIFAFRQVILLRSYIRLAPSDIVFRTV